ncbi:MAG: hypothetical protein ABIT58_09475 [Ferruginibacter sp.]
MKKYFSFLPLVILLLLFSACKKETENYKPSSSIRDYSPLETGKYITYKLDSIVYLSFGQTQTTRSYEAKYVVDSLLTDNGERPAYRIFRYIRKQNTDPWSPSGTFWAINTGGTLEFVENNMRYIKLEMPIENGTTWKGNAFIETTSLNSEVKYLDDWDYVFDAVGVAETVGTNNLDNVLTVNQHDETIGDPADAGSYSEVNYGQEKYAKGIGLVYRRFFHSEYQPGTGSGDGYTADGSYGVTLTMIDHN